MSLPSLDAPAVPDRTSDPAVAVATGLYLALVVAAPVLALADRVVDGAGLLYLVLLSLALISVALSWVTLGRRPSLAVRVGSSPTAWLLLVPTLAVGVWGFLVIGRVQPWGAVGLLFGLFGSLLAVALVAMIRSRYARAVVDATPDPTEWTAAWPDPQRTRIERVVLVVVAVSVAATFGGIALDLWAVVTAGQTVFVLALTAHNCVRERSYTATPAGLVVDHPAVRHLHPWTAFTGYSRSGETLHLHRRFRPDYRLSPDDPDAVERALAAHLDRLDD